MTTLTKPIKRSLTIPSINKPVIIEIDPETKRLGFHEKGRRHIYWISIMTVYALAIRAEAK